MNLKCRRTACDRSHDNCRHTQTGDLYCKPCAVKINRANPEVPGLIAIPHTPDQWSYRLRHCESLIKGWDSYSADPPTPEVITAAKEFLSLVTEKGAPLAKLNPSVVGGVGFTFRLPDNAAKVYAEFRNTGTLCAAFDTGRPKDDDDDGGVTNPVQPSPEVYADLVHRITQFLTSIDRFRTRVTEFQEYLDHEAARRTHFKEDGPYTPAHHDRDVAQTVGYKDKYLAEFPHMVVVAACDLHHDGLAAAVWDKIGPRRGPCESFRTEVEPCPFKRGSKLPPETGSDDDDPGGAHTHAEGAWTTLCLLKYDYDTFFVAYFFENEADAAMFRALAPNFEVQT